MRLAFSLCAALALSVPSMVFAAKESSTKEFAVPDLPPYQAAIKAIRRGEPGKADELAELVEALERWNREHLGKKIEGPPIPAGMVRLYSADSFFIDLPRSYAENSDVSEWLSNAFKNTPSRSSIVVPDVTGVILHYLKVASYNTGELWPQVKKKFNTRIAQEAEIIKRINANTADQIKTGLEGYSHLWPEWVKKGK